MPEANRRETKLAAMIKPRQTPMVGSSNETRLVASATPSLEPTGNPRRPRLAPGASPRPGPQQGEPLESWVQNPPNTLPGLQPAAA
jgi:hypothetical protein